MFLAYLYVHKLTLIASLTTETLVSILKDHRQLSIEDYHAISIRTRGRIVIHTSLWMLPGL